MADGRRLEYVRALDGLRAVAVVAVLAYHAGVPGARGGFLGVSLFFTLSGFLMASLLLREHEVSGTVRLRAFWERRLRRLAPASLLTLAAVALVGPRLAPTPDAALRGDLLAALGYVVNWRFVAGDTSYAAAFEAPSPVLHFWSLAIEEQFYVWLPLTVLAALAIGRGRRAVLAAVVGVAVVASAVAQVRAEGFDRVYFGTDTRAAELLAGVLLGIACAGRGPSLPRRALPAVVGVVGAGAFALLVVTTSPRAAWLADGGLLAVAAAHVALLVGALGRGPVAWVLARGPLVAVGRVSYGLYLYHWPVFLWLDERRAGTSGAALLALQVAVTAAVTVASYHLVECPVRHGRRLVTRGRVTGAFAAAVAGVVALSAAVVPRGADVASLLDPAVLDAPAAAPAAAHAPEPRLRVMVVGDSTGHAFAEALRTVPTLAVEDATRAGCPLLRFAYARRHALDRERDVRGCADWPFAWVQRAQEFRPDVVVVVSGPEDAGDLRDDGGVYGNVLALPWYLRATAQYQGAVAVLRTTGAVVAWADIPRYTFPERPDARAQDHLDLRVDLLNDAITRVTTETPGAVRLELARHLDRPDGVVDLTVRPDGLHLAPAAGRAAARAWMVRSLRQAVREARAEIGVADAAGALRVLVAGDSTSLNVAAGLANDARERGDLVVGWAGQIACPVLPVARFRMLAGDEHDYGGCRPPRELWQEHLASFRPDVVFVVSSFMDAVEMAPTEPDGWLDLTDDALAAAYRAELDALAALAVSAGAVVVWAHAPPVEVDDAGDTARARERLAARDAVVDVVAARWPQVVTLSFDRVAGGDREVDRTVQPDGVHFSVSSATELASRWLARDLRAAAAAARAETAPA